MPEFAHHALFPLADDATPYRLLSADHIGVERFRGGDMLTVEPDALGLLAEQAFLRHLALSQAGPPRPAPRHPRRRRGLGQ